MRRVSATANIGCCVPPLPGPTRSPISALRAVTTPAKGARTTAKDFIASSRPSAACASRTAATFTARSPFFSSASCFETEAVVSRSFQRTAVLRARPAWALALASAARASTICWSSSGVSIVPSGVPAPTVAPISFDQPRT